MCCNSYPPFLGSACYLVHNLAACAEFRYLKHNWGSALSARVRIWWASTPALYRLSVSFLILRQKRVLGFLAVLTFTELFDELYLCTYLLHHVIRGFAVTANMQHLITLDWRMSKPKQKYQVQGPVLRFEGIKRLRPNPKNMEARVEIESR